MEAAPNYLTRDNPSFGLLGYALLTMNGVKPPRRRGATRISPKHQVTIPQEALATAGLQVGDRLRVAVQGPGAVLLVREDDPLDEHAGALTGVYPRDYLGELRGEWRESASPP